MSVDLPAPFSPTRAWISPWRTENVTSSERLDARELLGDAAHLKKRVVAHPNRRFMLQVGEEEDGCAVVETAAHPSSYGRSLGLHFVCGVVPGVDELLE